MKKIPVGILGATGMVGQKFVELLSDHPWFEIVFLSASDKSQTKTYREAVRWMASKPLPRKIGNIIVADCLDSPPCHIIFSSLEPSIAGYIEDNLASQGYIVISNSSAHRMDDNVPLIIPEVNPTHIELIHKQNYKGFLITNPNCSVIGTTMALKPLLELSPVEQVNITTLQSLSGAGYPGISGMDIIDNIIPNIPGEEIKLETESRKILGSYKDLQLTPYPLLMSAQCMRVPVLEGHLCCLSIKLKKNIKQQQLIDHWEKFSAEPQTLKLPSAPKHPIIYLSGDHCPQPRLHRNLGKGMSVSIGRLRPCPLLDWKFVLLCHNTIRGAVGTAVLNAELIVKKGYAKH